MARQRTEPGFLGIAVLCVVVLAVGAGLTAFLAKQKKPPQQAPIEETPTRVEIQPVRFEEVSVAITGYGEAHARDEVAVSPEVAGRVIAVHPRLEVGEIIPKGERLFVIDPRDYETRVAEAQASVDQLENALTRVKRQYEIDQKRLETFGRSRDLAKADFERAQELYAKDQIESKSFVDSKEVAYNNAVDAYDQLAQTLDIYPIRIQEAKSNLAAARATLQQAHIDLERTIVTAPFDARVKSVDLEADEYVSPGQVVTTLADDSVLEIPVSLNSREARKWLRFDKTRRIDDKAWFNQLTRVPVEIAWTEALDQNQWQGALDRVERFDQDTRTLTVVVRVKGEEAKAPHAGRLPLVEGMFCRVQIPGRTASHVVKVPAEAVNFDRDASGFRTVYIATYDKENDQYRLVTRHVQESHIEGDYIYIADGLEEGDLVITTRLINPLENSLLEIQEPLPVETG